MSRVLQVALVCIVLKAHGAARLSAMDQVALGKHLKAPLGFHREEFFQGTEGSA